MAPGSKQTYDKLAICGRITITTGRDGKPSRARPCSTAHRCSLTANIAAPLDRRTSDRHPQESCGAPEERVNLTFLNSGSAAMTAARGERIYGSREPVVAVQWPNHSATRNSIHCRHGADGWPH